MLTRNGQAHLVAQLESATDAQKAALGAQLVALDATTPGGLDDYLTRACKLLSDSAAEVNPFAGYTPAIAPGARLTYDEAKWREAEAAGIELLEGRKVGFVLVAGGLGERLGYPGIKVALPTEITSGRSYLQNAIEHFVAFSKGEPLPFAIMTSADTHQRTIDALEANDYFGASAATVTVMMQEKVPALLNNDAHMLFDADFQIETKPHGHGDVHSLMLQKGLAQQWLSEGIEYVYFFQDTQGQALATTPALVGAAKVDELWFAMSAISRRAGEACGAVMTLQPDAAAAAAGKLPMTCNVEYNQINALFEDAGMGGDVNINPTTGEIDDGVDGISPYPGNTNQLVAHLQTYVDTLVATSGVVPEFVNPKYKDAARNSFKKPTRLECMMQVRGHRHRACARALLRAFRSARASRTPAFAHARTRPSSLRLFRLRVFCFVRRTMHSCCSSRSRTRRRTARWALRPSRASCTPR
mgnify:CR=1 FL=1